MTQPHHLAQGQPHDIPVAADYGAFIVSSEGDEPTLPDLNGTGLARMLQTTATTAWVGIEEQFMDLTVRLTTSDEAPPIGDADRVVECVLDCPDGRLGVHDGPVDATLRETVRVQPGRWALRFAFDHATPELVTVEAWPTTDPAGTTTVHRPEEQSTDTEDPDLRKGADAWDARYQMRGVISPRASELGAVTLHLDDDGELWGFSYDDKAQPLLRRVDPTTATDVLATGTIGPRWS